MRFLCLRKESMIAHSRGTLLANQAVKMNISQTRIYRTIQRKIKDDAKRSEVLKALKIVKQSGIHCSERTGLLSGAFIWSHTPQGHDYWNNINQEYLNGTY